jgi:hypothetical protein
MSTAPLIYVTNASVDGFIEDEAGRFDWTATSDTLFGFITEPTRPVEIYLDGRRRSETMAA